MTKDKMRFCFLLNKVVSILSERLNTTVYYDTVENDYDQTKIFTNDYSNAVSLSEAIKLVSIDYDSIRRHYENFTFPDWFRPTLKHRSIMSVNIHGKWKPLPRRANDTSKSTSDEKIRKTFARTLPARMYFKNAKVLDSRLEGKGEGIPLKDTIYPVLDIDGDTGDYTGKNKKSSHLHEKISGKPMCTKCFMNALNKLITAIGRLKIMGYENPKVLPSGSKGFHVHVTDHEVTEKEYFRILDTVNDGVKDSICDDFSFINKQGVRVWDYHRIWRLPGSIDSGTGIIIQPITPILLSEIKTAKNNDKLKKEYTHNYKEGDLVTIKKEIIRDPLVEFPHAGSGSFRITSITPAGYIKAKRLYENEVLLNPEWLRPATEKEQAIYLAKKL